MDSEKPKITINSQSNSWEHLNQMEWNGTIHHTVELEGREIDFWQQKNGHDCGPCLLLNMQDALNAKSNADPVTDVTAIRQWITDNAANGRSVQNGQLLVVSEIQDYIQNQLRLPQKIIKTNRDNQYQRQLTSPQSIGPIAINGRNKKISFMPEISPNELAQDNRNKFIWGVYNGSRTADLNGNRLLNEGNHYTGYLQTQRNIYLFDSRNNTFVQETQNELDDFIRHTVGAPFVAFAQPQIEIKNRANEQ